VLNKTQLQTRRCKAYALHVAGISYREIAAALGVSVGTAFNDVNAMASELHERFMLREERRIQVHLSRIAKIIFANWQAAMAGSEKAAGVFLEALRQEAELLGLTARAKAEIDFLGRIKEAIERQAAKRGLSEEDKERAIAEAERIFGRRS